MKHKYETIQSDIKDCGAACLSSIIKFYDGYVPLEKIKEDCLITKDGITAYNLIEASKSYGFQSYGTKLEINDLEANSIPLPLIAHMTYKNGLNHYIIVYKIDKKHLYVMDPAKGNQKIKKEDFLRDWSRVAIIIYPISSILKMEKIPSIINIFYNYIKSEKKLVLKILITSILLTITSIISSYYLKVLINSISLSYKNTILFLILVFLIVSVFKITLSFLREYYESYLNKNLDIKIIFPFINHIFNLPQKNLSSRTTGEIVKRIQELENIKELFGKLFLNIFIDSIISIVSIIILYKINSSLLLILLIVSILYIIFSILFNHPFLNNIKSNLILDTEFSSALIEYVDAIPSIRNTNKLSYILNNIEYKFSKYLDNTLSLNKLMNYQNLVKNFIETIGLFSITSYGIILIMNNELSLINLITFNSILVYFFEPLKSIIGIIPRILFLKASFNKVGEFMNLKKEDLGYNETFINGDIVLKNVSYSYNNFTYPINNFNLVIKETSKVMLKGPSGSGKSTICKLLYRIYDISSGSIYINNINIMDYQLNTIRKNITYASQNEKLFNTSIKENITLNEDITPQKLDEILKICHINEILDKLPLRLETPLIDNGHNLSGGELQRIKLARALLKDSKIIILDEALSEVDIPLETKIIKSIIKYFKDKTIIYVTHKNLSSSFDYTIDLDKLT